MTFLTLYCCHARKANCSYLFITLQRRRTWLRRGQILGWMQNAEVVDTDLHPLIHTLEPAFQSPDQSSPENTRVKVDIGPEIPLTNHQEQEKNKLTTTPVKAIVVTENGYQEPPRTTKLMAAFQLDKAAISPEQQSTLENLPLSHANIFTLDSSELGCTGVVKHRIDTGESPPIYQSARRIPFVLRGLVDDMIKDMLTQNIIQPSHSPWGSPVVLVKKKDGSMRFCVDYRRLNSVIKRDVHPLPRIDDTLDVLSGACYFTTLDLASGYWQVAMDPNDRGKNSFYHSFRAI